MKNWKTTVLGILAAGALGVSQSEKFGVDVDANIKKYAALAGLGLLGALGTFAADHKKEDPK